jgi:hypothetical protein
MRIRRNASRLLGSAVCAPPRFELPAPSGFELPPAPSGFELPPPAEESHLAGFVSKISSSLSEPCVENLSPWDLMGQLDLSDPQVIRAPVLLHVDPRLSLYSSSSAR